MSHALNPTLNRPRPLAGPHVRPWLTLAAALVAVVAVRRRCCS